MLHFLPNLDSRLQPTVEAIDVLDNTDPSSYLQLKPFKRRPRIVRYEWATNEVDNHPYTETQLKPDVFKIGGKIIHGCRICGQTFACQTSFARHRRVHVGESYTLVKRHCSSILTQC